MEIKEIINKNEWEDFLVGCKEKSFLDSWNWGEFQLKMNNKIWRLGVFDGQKIKATALITKIKAKRGTFLLIQHGPVFQNFNEDALNSLINELKNIAKQEKADFLRIAPLLENSKEKQIIFKKLGFRKSSMHANAYEATWMLDIIPSEEEILRNMRKTTRYLINHTIKNSDIQIEKNNSLQSLETYQKLNREVALRQKFVPFSQEYIKNEFDVFFKDNNALWLFGKYKGEVVAGALVIFWSGIGFYHQAASLSKYAHLSVPYLLQWEAIKEAKNRGCDLYNFWGFTDPKKYSKHPWAGPTLFKMGFGGYAKEYIKTQDLPLSKKYWLTFIFENLRKIKRGL